MEIDWIVSEKLVAHFLRIVYRKTDQSEEIFRFFLIKKIDCKLKIIFISGIKLHIDTFSIVHTHTHTKKNLGNFF